MSHWWLRHDAVTIEQWIFFIAQNKNSKCWKCCEFWFYTFTVFFTSANMTLKSEVIRGATRKGLWQSAPSDTEVLWLHGWISAYLVCSLNSLWPDWSEIFHHAGTVPSRLASPVSPSFSAPSGGSRWRHNELAALCLSQSSISFKFSKGLTVKSRGHAPQSERTHMNVPRYDFCTKSCFVKQKFKFCFCL